MPFRASSGQVAFIADLSGGNRRAPELRKVLITTDAVGGVWTYSLDLARYLGARGIETALAVLGPSPTDDQIGETSGIPDLKVISTGLALDWTAEDPASIRIAGRAISELANDLDSDLVHLNSPALAGVAAFARPLVVGCHSCVATWWNAVRGTGLPEDFAWRTELVRAGYEAAQALIAPTAAFSRATAEIYGLPHPPTVIHNGASRRSAGREEHPRSDSASSGDDFVLTAGRLWDEGKDLATLDRAAARLSVPVLAAGPQTGPNGAAIRLEHIRATGHVDRSQLLDLFDRRPIFASLARYEPFGLAVLEAAQAGCPLLLSDIPTFRELWDGVAIFVPPGDEAATAHQVQALLADPARRARLGWAACERSQQYGLDRMGSAILDLYGDVLRKSPAGSRPVLRSDMARAAS